MKINHKYNQTSAGFTLIELLVAASISGLVIALTGFGVVALTERNKNEKIETERRVDVNRALDFIAEEVRMAKKVELNAESASVTGFSPAGDAENVKKVLVLEVQTQAGMRNVVYYIASLKNSLTNPSVWSGPKVIYRWGPIFDGAGSYTAASNQNSVLVDFIEDSSISPTCNPSNWTLNPPDSVTGFYACVDPSGKLASVNIRGKLTNAYGSSKPPLEVSTKAFPRPYEVTISPDTAADEKDANAIAAAKEAEHKAAVDDAVKIAQEAKDKADATDKIVEQAKKDADKAAKEYTDAKNYADKLAQDAQKAAEDAAKLQTSAAYQKAEEAAKKYAEAEKIAAQYANIAQTIADKLKTVYDDAAKANTEYADATKSAIGVDTKNADKYSRDYQEAANKAAEYTTAAQNVPQYTAANHNNAALTAENNALKYDTAADKFVVAEQKATEYQTAKQTADNLAKTADNTAKQADNKRTSTAYTEAINTNKEYAAAERAAAEKAKDAQTALNEAVKFATGTEAAVKYATDPHNAAAQAAEQRVTQYTFAADQLDAQRFTVSNGTLNVTQDSKVSVEVLGGSIVCASGQPDIPTVTTVNINTPRKNNRGQTTWQTTNTTLSSTSQSSTLLVTTGSTVTISGRLLSRSEAKDENYCNLPSVNYNSATHNNTQVLTLRNGQKPPSLTPFGNGQRIDEFLKKYLDPKTGTITIRPNQAIFLFELFATSSSSSAYDLQDLVVLATFTSQ